MNDDLGELVDAAEASLCRSPLHGFTVRQSELVDDLVLNNLRAVARIVDIAGSDEVLLDALNEVIDYFEAVMAKEERDG